MRAWDEPPKSGAQDRRAADVLLDSGVLVQPFPIWREDWEHPETTPNSALLAEIDRDGIPL
ncbi:MAG: nucleotidyltransferase [Thiohalocapsa sp.]|nr:nucleotidyltransferase [Thiohalocapsa sp.]MCF7991826.1 nucleotidyltransferase [Thiohalocapsa sp.]